MKNKVLIYDDHCPLCAWYSGLFVKYGFLPSDGRRPFSTLDDCLLSKIDFNKSRNEIPLLDLSTNEVAYGIDALLEILGQKIPFIKTVGNRAPLRWILRRLYKLISFNRKVIVASRCSPGSIDCTPDNDYLYRRVFMVVGLLFNTIMLFPLQAVLLSKLSFYHLDILQLQTAHFVFVIINCTLASFFSKAKGYNYLGQVNILAMTATILLTPLMIVSNFFYSEWASLAWLLATTAVVSKEYIRRMEFAGVLTTNKWVVSMNLLTLMAFILFLFH